jgi:hypothetical protein
MAVPFVVATSIDYPIVDADAHVYEPRDLWQSRVPGALRARAPLCRRTENGDVWSFDDGARRRPVGLMAAAGTSYLGFRPAGLTYDDMRAAFFEPAARLADMDADGVFAQLLYPSVCEEGARMFGDDRQPGNGGGRGPGQRLILAAPSTLRGCPAYGPESHAVARGAGRAQLEA